MTTVSRFVRIADDTDTSRWRFLNVYGRLTADRDEALDLIAVPRTADIDAEPCLLCGSTIGEESLHESYFDKMLVATPTKDRDIVTYAYHGASGADERTDTKRWACPPTAFGRIVDVFHIECALGAALQSLFDAEKSGYGVQITVCRRERVQATLGLTRLPEDMLWSLLLTYETETLPEYVVDAVDWYLLALEHVRTSTIMIDAERRFAQAELQRIDTWLTTPVVAGDERREALRERVRQSRAAGILLRTDRYEGNPVPTFMVEKVVFNVPLLIKRYNNIEFQYPRRAFLDALRLECIEKGETYALETVYALDAAAPKLKLRPIDFAYRNLAGIPKLYTTGPYKTGMTPIIMVIVQHQRYSVQNSLLLEYIARQQLEVHYTELVLLLPYCTVTNNILEASAWNFDWVRLLLRSFTDDDEKSLAIQYVRGTITQENLDAKENLTLSFMRMLIDEFNVVPTVEWMAMLVARVESPDWFRLLELGAPWSIEDQLTLLTKMIDKESEYMFRKFFFDKFEENYGYGEYPISYSYEMENREQMEQIILAIVRTNKKDLLGMLLDNDSNDGSLGYPVTIFLFIIPGTYEREYEKTVDLVDIIERLEFYSTLPDADVARREARILFDKIGDQMQYLGGYLFHEKIDVNIIRRVLVSSFLLGILDDTSLGMALLYASDDAVYLESALKMLIDIGITKIGVKELLSASDFEEIPVSMYQLLSSVATNEEREELRLLFFFSRVYENKFVEADEFLGEDKELRSYIHLSFITEEQLNFLWEKKYRISPQLLIELFQENLERLDEFILHGLDMSLYLETKVGRMTYIGDHDMDRNISLIRAFVERGATIPPLLIVSVFAFLDAEKEWTNKRTIARTKTFLTTLSVDPVLAPAVSSVVRRNALQWVVTHGKIDMVEHLLQLDYPTEDITFDFTDDVSTDVRARIQALITDATSVGARLKRARITRAPIAVAPLRVIDSHELVESMLKRLEFDE